MAGQFVLEISEVFILAAGQWPRFLSVLQSNPDARITELAGDEHHVLAKTLDALAAGAFQRESAGLTNGILNFRACLQRIAQHAPDGKPFAAEIEFPRRQQND